MKLTSNYSKLWAVAWAILCCLILILGIQNVASAFLRHADHPEWDFVLRHGEVSCLSQLHVDPYDIFAENIRNNRYLPYYLDFKERDDVLNYHWCAGYPPWEYTLLLPLSRFSVWTADGIYKVFELLSLFVVIVFSFRRSSRFKTSIWAKLLLAYSVFLLPPEAWNYVFRFGNWTLPFCAGVVCLVLFLDKGWQVLAGFAWAFLMIKPQQGIWFVIPILFRRQFKTIAVAVATCLAASIPPAVLCGKSPLELILEIPKFRLQPYTETSLFSSRAYAFFDAWLFPKAALFLGLAICLAFCIWATWKWRREQDWFIFLQPTFFCICAGYPLWHQDWLFFFFPLIFLLEVWSRPGTDSRLIRIVVSVLACALVNPLSWIHHYISRRTLAVLTNSEAIAYATWALFTFLVFLVEFYNTRQLENQKSDSQMSSEWTFASEFRKRYRYFFFFSVLTVFLVFAAYDKNGSRLSIDDADIFFGYAENLCLGRGITYAGNGVPSEGTTSMLWLLLCSAIFKIRLNEPGVLILSLALLLGAQWLWIQILSGLLSGQKRMTVLFIYVIVVLSAAGYVTWMSISLMDTALWGFLVAWMTLELLRVPEPTHSTAWKWMATAVPFALAPWARPEAMLVVPCGLALCVLFRRVNGRCVRDVFIRGLAFLVSLAVLTGFRLTYFGYPIPNTYYAKVSPSFVYNVQQGTWYLLRYLRSGVFPYLAAFCFLIVAARTVVRTLRGNADRAETFSDFVLLWLWALVLVLPPVFAGGDHFGYCRFFQPVWPLLVVLLVTTFSRLPLPSWPNPTGVDWARIVALFAFALFSFFSGWKKWGGNPGWLSPSPLNREFDIAETERENGRILTRLFTDWSEKPVLGVISAGGISRTYREKIVDLMGLNNNQIAHHSGDRIGIKNHAAFEPELFDSLRVDLMPFTPNSFRSRALKGMLETESFVADWRCGRIRKNGTEEETPPFFVEKGFLDRLLSTDNFSFRDSYRFEDGSWKEIKEDVSPGGQ